MNILFGFISLFVGVLEIFSHLTRMLSFTFRLFGNMTAGEILIAVSCFLVPDGVPHAFLRARIAHRHDPGSDLLRVNPGFRNNCRIATRRVRIK